MDRAGYRLLESQLIATQQTLELLLSDPQLRAGIVVDEPGADLDTAAAAAISHLEAARAVLAPFFWQRYAVGDIVDVMEIRETTGDERVKLARVTVVEIHGKDFLPTTVVEDSRGNRHVVSPGDDIRQHNVDR